MPLDSAGLPRFHGCGSHVSSAEIVVFAGLALILAGIVTTTIVQFLMAQRLRELSETLGNRVILIGAPMA